MPTEPITYFFREILPLLIGPAVICAALLSLRWRHIDRWIKRDSTTDPKRTCDPLNR
jgi:hypothetical protein